MFNFKVIQEIYRRYDFSFFGISFIIFFIGLLNLYSVTSTSTIGHRAGLYKIQLAYFAISILVGFFVSLINVKNYLSLQLSDLFF